MSVRDRACSVCMQHKHINSQASHHTQVSLALTRPKHETSKIGAAESFSEIFCAAECEKCVENRKS